MSPTPESTPPPEPRRIAVSGASGLVGRVLVRRLAAAGHVVSRMVRRPPLAGEIRWDPATGELPAAELEGMDAVVHLAGAPIGDRRWSKQYRETILRSRVDGTDLVARTLATLDRPPRVLLSASGINVYGDRGDDVIDESSPQGTGFLADVAAAWEAATEPATAAGIEVVRLRSGIVLSADGGALRRQLPIFKLGLGGKFGSGEQWQSWISLDDEVGAIEHLIGTGGTGPVNLTTPNPVTNAEFTTTLAGVLRRPHFLTVPAAAVRLVLGRQMADELLFTSMRVQPAALLAAGYTFRHPTLDGALRAVLG
jgi:uncharacterized protein (TIGR01777 family)